MRLIDADELIEQLTPPEDAPNNGAKLLLAVFVDAVNAFSTIDAVPVVRCGECKYYLESNEKCSLIDTRLHFYETDNVWAGDSYCSWGKRREDGDNDATD